MSVTSAHRSGVLASSRIAVALAERPIRGERAAGLAHEPDRRRVDRLAAARAQEAIVHAAASRNAVAGRLERRLDLGVAVGHRQEPRLERRRRQEDALVEHRAEEPRDRPRGPTRAPRRRRPARSARKKTVSSGPTRRDGDGRARRRDAAAASPAASVRGRLLERDVALGRRARRASRSRPPSTADGPDSVPAW